MKTAYWIKHERLFDPATYECSACGSAYYRDYPECPKCGAEMTGGKTDPEWIEEAAFLDVLTGGFGK